MSDQLRDKHPGYSEQLTVIGKRSILRNKHRSAMVFRIPTLDMTIICIIPRKNETRATLYIKKG